MPVNVEPKTSGGKGGLWGKIAGGALALAGAVAAPFTGGATAALLPAAGALMGMAGPLIGNAIDPLKQTSGRSNTPLESYMKNDPEAQTAVLQEAMKSTIDRPDIFGSTQEQTDALSKMGAAKDAQLGLAKMRRRMA